MKIVTQVQSPIIGVTNTPIVEVLCNLRCAAGYLIKKCGKKLEGEVNTFNEPSSLGVEIQVFLVPSTIGIEDGTYLIDDPYCRAPHVDIDQVLLLKVKELEVVLLHHSQVGVLAPADDFCGIIYVYTGKELHDIPAREAEIKAHLDYSVRNNRHLAGISNRPRLDPTAWKDVGYFTACEKDELERNYLNPILRYPDMSIVLGGKDFRFYGYSCKVYNTHLGY